MSDSVRPHRWQPARLPGSWDSPGKNTEVGCHCLLHYEQIYGNKLDNLEEMDRFLEKCSLSSLPGSSVHGILQARILEWVAMPSSRGSSQPRDWTWISCIAGRFFIMWATREVPSHPPQRKRWWKFRHLVMQIKTVSHPLEGLKCKTKIPENMKCINISSLMVTSLPHSYKLLLLLLSLFSRVQLCATP